MLEELEAEVAQLEKSGADRADVHVKMGLMEQYKLLKDRFSAKEGEGSPSFQFLCLPVLYASQSKLYHPYFWVVWSVTAGLNYQTKQHRGRNTSL